jgi:glucose-1-phosphate thymidylyltransferase
MKGIICAGGSGTRLNPLTLVTNKHLLAVYDKPMIFYPLFSLIDAGITEIMVVCSNEHSGSFQKLLGSGKNFGVDISFKVQDNSGGIAEAVGLCSSFVGKDSVAVILGDNIFEDSFKDAVSNFKSGAHLFLKNVNDPERFGVAELNNEGNVVNIVEKPKNPNSNFAITGFYLYDNLVFDIISGLEYSDRDELEITDVNNVYVKNNTANASIIRGEWTDAGTFESLYKANKVARSLTLAGNFSIEAHRAQASLNKKVSSDGLKSENIVNSIMSS